MGVYIYMKKLLYVSTIFVDVLGISIYVNGNKNLNSNDINNEKYNTLGLLLETEVGSGVYETSSSDTYPTSGYKLIVSYLNMKMAESFLGMM